MKKIQVIVTEPARKRSEFHTLDTDGNEVKILERFNLTYDPNISKWIGGRADGTGATVRTTDFQDLWMLVGTRIQEDHFKEPVDSN